MTVTALTNTGQQTRTIGRSSPLLRVMTWEFRRFFASRLFWFQALGLFGFLLLMTWAMHAPENIDAGVSVGGGGGEPLSGSVAGTSAGGLLHTLPIVLVVLALLLPFVTADGVTRELNRRTHELLMTTALPTWAYVWGRYLAGLVISLGLALLLLASILGMGGFLHLTVADYPLPQIGTVLLLWVGMVVSATILVSSFGFALSTLLPRLSTLVKVVIMVAWIVGGLVIPLARGYRSSYRVRQLGPDQRDNRTGPASFVYHYPRLHDHERGAISAVHSQRGEQDARPYGLVRATSAAGRA